MKMNRIVRMATTGAVAAILAACGGGGNGGGGGNSPTYAVGGTVAGLSGALVLQDNGIDDLRLTADGMLAFSTELASGATYAVTVRTAPAGQSCVVNNGSGTIAAANVTNVAVICATAAGGALDTTFGSGGKFLIPPGFAQGVVVQPDGMIVVLTQGPLASGSSFTLIRFNPDGSLDATFGVGGKATGDLGGMNLAGEQANSLAMQTDGKLVVAGIGTGLVNGVVNAEFALARYDANGQIDASFGLGGKVFSSFGNGRSSFLRALAIQADGRLVAVGSTPGGRNDYNFAIARFLADGSLDASFASGGTVVTDFSQRSNDNSAESIALQADGKLVVAGWNQLGGSGSDIAPALARYNTDGSLDTTFGAGGQVSNTALIDNFGGAARVAIQADGKIVLAKNVDSGGVDFALSRYDADGSRDTSFGSSGVVTTDLSGGNQDLSNALLIQGDGKLIVAGYSQGPTSARFALVRYLSDGGLDTTFGTAGKVLTDFGLPFASCTALAIQSDGKLVAVGGATDGTARLAVARFMP